MYHFPSGSAVALVCNTRHALCTLRIPHGFRGLFSRATRLYVCHGSFVYDIVLL